MLFKIRHYISDFIIKRFIYMSLSLTKVFKLFGKSRRITSFISKVLCHGKSVQLF